jgi:hypothetical protein
MAFYAQKPNQSCEHYITINKRDFVIYDEMRYGDHFPTYLVAEVMDDGWAMSMRTFASLKEAYDHIYLLSLT